MFAPDVLDPTVDFLADLAGAGPALELAIGTGRVGVPLAARGIPVTGIELSAPMVAELRRKVDEATCRSSSATWRPTTVPGEFSLVYLVCNSIGNLRTQDEQVRVLPQCRSAPAPRWPLRHRARGCRAAALSAGPGGRALRREPTPRRLRHLRHDDAAGHLAPLHARRRRHRSATAPATSATSGPPSATSWPSSPACSWSSASPDWDRSPFTAESESHVSVWRKP